MIFFSVLGDLAVSLNLNPLYLMLPAAVIIINILMLIMIVVIANQSWLSWCWCGWRWSCWSLIINADDDGSQVTCCYAFMLPVACPTNAIVYKASGSKIIMIIIDYDQHKVLSGYFNPLKSWIYEMGPSVISAVLGILWMSSTLWNSDSGLCRIDVSTLSEVQV